MADVLGLSVPHLIASCRSCGAQQLITSNAHLIELTDLAGLRRLAQYQPLVLAPIPLPRR
ncbi:hypothetical protein LB566_30200 [Mesorhizobium sp. CA13]|jgi:hypothetical protein|uniref:hypothetical protein n=1 Tax=unclassified Mesorhizobium TaxID=325217 RepID=UPI00112E22FE|nr:MULTISPECIES: hypothetical protein [unclassified Mesorhizobium]MBZ9858051.1 hypothetical protein [Mesorhizobium sp. CA13]MBZ9921587.1 hypothetical protein [Mesorhizobium sp. BR1-1-7]MBZ9967921.1 hypothetical protein [Mesorhizobium sp. BR1-1-2]MCA0014911.1 hypothetical protein [Mesorhizobium sp. B294B1A1]MCA0040969.1 hypothetical protein [Mesorhizobium sp. B292B1B]